MFILLQFERTRNTEFDTRNVYRPMLEYELNFFATVVIEELQFYKESLKQYSDLMMNSVNGTQSFTENGLLTMHQHSKFKAIEQVRH